MGLSSTLLNFCENFTGTWDSALRLPEVRLWLDERERDSGMSVLDMGSCR